MSKKSRMDAILAYSTLALAVGTFAMALFTYLLVSESKDDSTRQIGVQSWLEMEKRFDSNEMKAARSKLAHEFLAGETQHELVSETVMNFFEDVGALYKKGYIDKDLTESSFSYYGCRWWEACKSYVDAEEKRHGEDVTLFEDFRDLAKSLRLSNEKIDDAELKHFLEDETRIGPE